MDEIHLSRVPRWLRGSLDGLLRVGDARVETEGAWRDASGPIYGAWPGDTVSLRWGWAQPAIDGAARQSGPVDRGGQLVCRSRGLRAKWRPPRCHTAVESSADWAQSPGSDRKWASATK